MHYPDFGKMDTFMVQLCLPFLVGIVNQAWNLS